MGGGRLDERETGLYMCLCTVLYKKKSVHIHVGDSSPRVCSKNSSSLMGHCVLKTVFLEFTQFYFSDCTK